MLFGGFIKKYGAVIVICALTPLGATTTGLLGGQDNLGQPWAATIGETSTDIHTIPFSFSTGQIRSVALNNQGFGLIGGQVNGSSYVASIDPSSNLTRILGLTDPGSVFGVAINNQGIGLVANSSSTTTDGYKIVGNTASPITFPGTSSMSSCAINDSNVGIFAGISGGNMYAAWYVSDLLFPISGFAVGGALEEVALNESGTAIIGGIDITIPADPYVYIVAPSSTTATQVFTGTGGEVTSVAINKSGVGVFGIRSAVGGTMGAFLGAVSGGTTNAILELPNPAGLNAVAINDNGQIIAGGNDAGDHPFLVTVAPGSFLVTQVNLGLNSLLTGSINSVAINEFGQSLIGGTVNNVAYAAIVSGTTVVPLNLNLPANSLINSVAFRSIVPTISLLTHIPTGSLTKNNLAFANYINANAPDKSFYFVPSEFDNTLNKALESAAPTRNAFSFNTVMQNSFYLTTSLATHLRDQIFVRRRGPRPSNNSAAANETEKSEQLIVGLTVPDQKQCPTQCPKYKADPCAPDYSMSVWIEGLGVLAYQNRQHQSPAFNPDTAGGILGVDAYVSRNIKVGGGGSYLYTHIHEKHNQGHSNINQEGLFVYGSFETQMFYVDLAVWGSLYQTTQVRNIGMAGFDFISRSSVSGGLCTPHLEFGFNGTPTYTSSFQFTYNPFVMVDWANNWQDSYREKGSGPFNAGQKSYHASLLRTEAAIRFNEVMFFNCWNLIIEEKAGYVNIQSFNAGKVRAFLVGSPGSFTVETLTNAQNLGVAQLLFTFAHMKPSLPITTVFYQGEFGSGYKSHQVNLELAWNF